MADRDVLLLYLINYMWNGINERCLVLAGIQMHTNSQAGFDSTRLFFCVEMKLKIVQR